MWKFLQESWKSFVEASIWTTYWVEGYSDSEIEEFMKEK